MIVDDSPLYREVLTEMLKEEGFFSLITASSATEALDRLRDQRKPIDLVLMDIVMPGMDGIDAVRAMRNDKATFETPVVMVSSDDEEVRIDEAFRAGASDFISKPVRALDLRARVRSVLRLREETLRRQQHERRLVKALKSMERLNAKLLALSNQDGLTGVANRRAFDRQLKSMWEGACKDEECVSIAMIDIDYFKRFNDKYGHLLGDECLKRVAKALQSFCIEERFVARYGGEEFAALSKGASGREMAEELCEAIRALKIPHEGSNVQPYVTISVGMAYTIFPEQFDCAALLKLADQALYEAKNAGRNQVKVRALEPASQDQILAS